MHKIDGAGHVANTWVAEDIPTNRPPTEITPDWMNAIQEEVVNAVQINGAALVKGDNTQLKTELLKRFEKRIAVAGGTADALTADFTTDLLLTNGQPFYLRSVAANTVVAPTLNADDTGVRPIVKGNNLPLVAGDILGGGAWLEMQYDLTLDKYVLLNPATGIIPVVMPTVASIQGAFKKLQVSATGLSANVTVTAGEIVVEDAANSYKTLRAVNLTIAGTASGAANGLDAGALEINSWYSVWVIWNGATIAGLLSLSATEPTLPAGYTHKARVGWIRTDASGNKYPLSFIQAGRKVQYKVAAGSNVVAPPAACVGTQGTWSTTAPTWASVAIGSFVPSTASKISVGALSSYNNAAQTNVAVAPNASYGGTRTANCPPISVTVNGGSGVANDIVHGEFALESTNIYVVIQTANGSVIVYGWEDNI